MATGRQRVDIGTQSTNTSEKPRIQVGRILCSTTLVELMFRLEMRLALFLIHIS